MNIPRECPTCGEAPARWCWYRRFAAERPEVECGDCGFIVKVDPMPERDTMPAGADQ